MSAVFGRRIFRAQPLSLPLSLSLSLSLDDILPNAGEHKLPRSRPFLLPPPTTACFLAGGKERETRFPDAVNYFHRALSAANAASSRCRVSQRFHLLPCLLFLTIQGRSEKNQLLSLALLAKSRSLANSIRIYSVRASGSTVSVVARMLRRARMISPNRRAARGYQRTRGVRLNDGTAIAGAIESPHKLNRGGKKVRERTRAVLHGRPLGSLLIPLPRSTGIDSPKDIMKRTGTHAGPSDTYL